MLRNLHEGPTVPVRPAAKLEITSGLSDSSIEDEVVERGRSRGKERRHGEIYYFSGDHSRIE